MNCRIGKGNNMNRVFSLDGKLFGFFNKTADLVLLNLLWLLCSLPIVTAGASTTALYYVAMKIARNEESYIVRSFFRSFRENFRQATVIWGMELLLGAVLYFDFYFSGHMPSQGAKLMFIPFAVIGFVLLVTGSYVFPVLSFFENSVKNTVKNAFLMAAGNLFYTSLILLVNAGPLLTLLAFWSQPALGTFLLITVSVSFFAWVNSHIFIKMFQTMI